MRTAVLTAAIAVTLLSALPASAEVVVRADPGGVSVGERHDSYRHHRHHSYSYRQNYRHHYASCRTIRTRTELPSGRVIVKTRQSC